MANSNDALILPAQPATSPQGTQAGTVDIRGIKGPVAIPSTYGWLGWVLAAMIAGALAWWAWRRLRLRKTSLKPALLIPPHRRAKDKLRNASELMSDPYAFCSLVSDVVRTYLEERFDLHAPDRTTEEFLAELRSGATLRPDHKALLEEFLLSCDLVKFARFEPSQDELRSLLDAALRFIDETAPVSAPETTTSEQKAA